jgi:hypothetical protein
MDASSSPQRLIFSVEHTYCGYTRSGSVPGAEQLPGEGLRGQFLQMRYPPRPQLPQRLGPGLRDPVPVLPG